MGILSFFKNKQWWKKPWVPIVLAGILVLAVLIAALCLRSCQDTQGPEAPPDWIDELPATDDEPVTDPVGSQPVPGEDTASDPQGSNTDPAGVPDTPGESAPRPTQPAQNQGGSSAPQRPVTTPPVTTPKEEKLSVDSFAAFNGAYVEDGSDEPVQNVAAILVTNKSEEYLDIAELTCLLDGKKATFTATGLPAGTSAWVMEDDRQTARADSTLVLQDTLTSFRADAVSSLEGLQIQHGGSLLKVTNNREKALRNVTVYYKVLHSDGNYFGGITYMVTFADLEPGQSAEKIAGHFKDGWTQIVRIGFQEDP